MRFIAITLAFVLIVIAGCSQAEDSLEEPTEVQAGESEAGNTSEGAVTSVSPVDTPDDDEVGESNLERETDGIVLIFEACCAIPGNAYTAWWLIGDVTLPMSAVKTPQAEGWVAESEQINLELELESGVDGLNSMQDGIRLVVLDHGPETGDPSQLNTPGGGCSTTPCPTIFTTSHPAP